MLQHDRFSNGHFMKIMRKEKKTNFCRPEIRNLTEIYMVLLKLYLNENRNQV